MLHSNPADFAYAFVFMESFILQVGCIIKFTATSAVIDWSLWTIGSIGSGVSCLGQVFAT